MLYFDLNEYFCYENMKAEIDGFTYDFDQNGCVLNYVTVGENRMYSTITGAVKILIERYPKLASYSSNEIMAIIQIAEGVYMEGINLDELAIVSDETVSGIKFVGQGNVIWSSEERYPTGVLCGYGMNEYENIIFKAIGENAYAYHYEAGPHTLTAGNSTVFLNCTFISENNAGVGIGSAMYNTNILFENCTFKGMNSDIYFHNSTFEGSDDNLLVFKNCKADSILIHDAARLWSNRKSKLNVVFQNNEFGKLILFAGNYGENAGEYYDEIPEWYDNIVMCDSYGNSRDTFNNKDVLQLERVA